MRMRTICAGGAAIVMATSAAVSAHAQDQASRGLVGACFTCHGTEGRSVGGVPPSIAGQDRAYLLQALKEFKAGKRPATIMHQQAKGYTDEQLERIAAYFSSVKPGPAGAAPTGRGSY